MAPFRNCPKERHKNIWAGVDALIARRVIRSPRIVYDEIAARQDGPLSWLGTRQQIFAKPNADVLNSVVQINSKHPLLVNRNKSKRGADPHVIALAVLLGQLGLLGLVPVIVTEEAYILAGSQRSHTSLGSTAYPASKSMFCSSGRGSASDLARAAVRRSCRSRCHPRQRREVR